MTDCRTLGVSAGTGMQGVAGAQAPSQGRRWLVLAILTAIYVFNFLDRQILSVLNEPIKAELRLSDAQMGALSGLAFALFYTTFAIPVAWLADRTSRIRIIALACAIWSACSAACGLAGNFTQLALARVGVGMGEAGGSPPSYSLISDYFGPRERGRALSIYSLGVALGPALGAALGGWVASRWGWRAAFVAVAAPGLLLALLAWRFVPEPRRGGLDPKVAEVGGGLLDSFRDFIRNPALVAVAVTSGLSAFVGYAISAWTPALLMRTKGMSLSEVAAYYSVMTGLITAAGTLASGFAADWAGRRSVRAYALIPGLAYLIAAPFFVAALLAPGWRWTLACLAVPALLTNTFLAPALAVVQNAAPANRRSAYSALLLFVLNLVGLGGGPLFVGLMSDSLAPRLGADALRGALGLLVPLFLLTVVAQLHAGRMFQRHLTRTA